MRISEGDEMGEIGEEVPSTPVVRTMDLRMPWEKDVVETKGEKQLRREVLSSLEGVTQKCVSSRNTS